MAVRGSENIYRRYQQPRALSCWLASGSIKTSPSRRIHRIKSVATEWRLAEAAIPRLWRVPLLPETECDLEGVVIAYLIIKVCLAFLGPITARASS